MDRALKEWGSHGVLGKDGVAIVTIAHLPLGCRAQEEESRVHRRAWPQADVLGSNGAP